MERCSGQGVIRRYPGTIWINWCYLISVPCWFMIPGIPLTLNPLILCIVEWDVWKWRPAQESVAHTHTLTLHSCSFMTFMFFGLQHVSIGFAFARLWRHSDSRGLQTTTSNNVYSIYIIYIYIIYLIYIYIDIHAMCSCRQIKLTSSSVFLWLKRQPLDVDATVATTGCLQSSWFCLPWVTWLSLAQLKMLDSDPLAG